MNLKDNKENVSSLEFSKLEFDHWYQGIYSAYMIATFHNIADLFTLVLKTNPVYAIFIIRVIFIWVFFILTFIIGMLNHYYVRVVRDHIKKFENYKKFKKVFEYFCNEKGIVDYWRVDDFILEFFKSPQSMDFGKFEDQERLSIIIYKTNQKTVKDAFCDFIRQHTTLLRIQTRS